MFYGVVVHGLPHTQPWIDASPGEQIHRGQVLGQAQGVFPAERGDRGAQLDPGRALARGSHDCHRGRYAELQMAVPEPGTVEPKPLAKFNDLQR